MSVAGLEGQEELLESLLRASPVGLGLVDREFRFVQINPALAAINGGRVEDHLGRTVAESVPALWPELEPLYRRVFDHGESVLHRETLAGNGSGADGGRRELLATMFPVRVGGEIVAAGVNVVDISDYMEADTARRASEGRYEKLVELARDAIFTATPAGELVSINPAGERLSGYSAAEAAGLSFLDLVVPADRVRVVEVLAQELAGEGDERPVEVEFVDRDGHPVPVEVAAWVVWENGLPVGVQGIVRDMTERRAFEEQLHHEAFHDPLTGLPNRALFADRLEQALGRVGRTGGRLAVVMLDLDNFKRVNDGFGHQAGDEVLVALARSLREGLRDGDSVARLGGDEFAFLLENLESDREAAVIVGRILASVAELNCPVQAGQRLSASAGVAFCGRGDSGKSVLRNADIAMYRAKASDQHGIEIFDDKMRARLMHELAVEHDLELALAADELILHYQPIVSIPDGKPLAVEALLRWRHPKWGWVQPSEFIPIAEENGLIVPLGRWVLAQAARQAAIWRHTYPDALPLGVFVNASPRELAQPDYPDSLTRILSEHGAHPDDIALEITERSVIDSANPTLTANIRKLSARGTRIVLDDFGTGYSALSTLKQFPFAAIKIDRYFMRAVKKPDDPAPITTAIIALAHSLGLTVISEGVETDLHAQRLRDLRCDAGQGYHFARPRPATEIGRLLDQTLPRPEVVQRSRSLNPVRRAANFGKS